MSKGYTPKSGMNPALKKLRIQQLEAQLHQIKKQNAFNEPIIYQWFDEFQVFMDWQSKHGLALDPFDGNKGNQGSWATVFPPLEENAPFTLKIDIQASSMGDTKYKALLFHEFTHIFDREQKESKFTENEAIEAFSWYTESHAQETAIKQLLGFRTVKEKRTVSLGDKILWDNSNISLTELVEMEFEKVRVRINNFQYRKALRPLQYYSGVLHFIKNYTYENPLNYFHSDYLKNGLGESVLDLFHLIVNIAWDDPPYLKLKKLDQEVTLLLATKIVENDVLGVY